MQAPAFTAPDEAGTLETEWPASITASPIPAVELAEDDPPAAGFADPEASYDSAYDQGDYDAAAELARAAIDRAEPDEHLWVVLVRSLANRGRLLEAGEACAAALDRHGLSKELMHLHAILLSEAGRHSEAASAARRALYLDPHFTVAHLALGDALARMGNPDAARRAFANAEAQLLGLDPDAPVPGGDGAVAAQLLRIARFRLEMLGDASQVPAR
jgi:tetratricopeptide (TPR) repeat protein